MSRERRETAARPWKELAAKGLGVRGHLAGALVVSVLAGCTVQPNPVRSAEASQLSAADTVTHFGFGEPAPDALIEAWDIDVRPDGVGLPLGSGSVSEGQEFYAARCAYCHGATGREGPNDRLAGDAVEGFPFGQSAELRRLKHVGNYWPYATTLFDYIRRTMPFDSPGTLSADEIYSSVAFVLYLNGLVPEDAVMDATTLPAVMMPARDRFVPDDRTGGAVIR